MVRRPSRPSAPAGTSPQTQSERPATPVPHYVTDPSASLQPWALEVELGTLTLEIPALTAADWLQVLFQDFDIWDIIPGLCPDYADEVDEILLQGHVTLPMFRDLCLELITEATGRPWWYVLRLVGVVKGSWEIVGGELAFRGIRADELSLGAWLDAVLLICLRNLGSTEDTMMFTSQLEKPPPDLENVPGTSQESDDEPDPEDGLRGGMDMSRASFLALR